MSLILAVLKLLLTMAYFLIRLFSWFINPLEEFIMTGVDLKDRPRRYDSYDRESY